MEELEVIRNKILKCCFNPSLFDDRDLAGYEIDYKGIDEIIMDTYKEGYDDGLKDGLYK
jgi:hypothetical protein